MSLPAAPPLHVLPCPSGPAVTTVWLDPLRAALDGTGPALVPVPDGPAADRVRAMARPDVPVEDGPDGEPVALVVPTSGSTGEPKGALLTGAALRHSAAATHERLGGPGAWLLALPVTHIAGLQVLVRSLLAGETPECLDLTSSFTASAFVRASRRLRGRTDGRRYTALVPTQLARLLGAAGTVDTDDSDTGTADTDAAVTELAGFDGVLLGGAATPPPLLERARAAGVRVVTTYGMSETGGGCVYNGVPLRGVRVEVPDDDAAATAGGARGAGDAGRVGAVRLGGPTVFVGYRCRHDLDTGALLVRDGVRWHLTRDLGALEPDGRLTVLGRLDDVIVTGGEKVAPAAVEAALCRLPGVREAAVVGVPDRDWGQRVVAVLVGDDPRPDVADGGRATIPDLRRLRAELAASLPRHALPRAVLTVPALPLLGSGKVDRGRLVELARQAEGGRR